MDKTIEYDKCASAVVTAADGHDAEDDMTLPAKHATDVAMAKVAGDADASQDPVFVEEQLHLSQTYDKLLQIDRDLRTRLAANLREVQRFKGDMTDELSQDFDSSDFTMETLAAYDVMNNVIDSFNISNDIDAENLGRIQTLLRKPYFAMVRLKFPRRQQAKDVYLGSVGIADERHRQLVVDWRSPIAETYYSQDNGPTTYEVEGRRVNVDLELRRQFDIEGRTLRSYFDTTVAIEDPLLISSLSKHRSASLQAITATIQKEQNEVIRHENVPALLVSGIAGSGKTSVLLQRIAYLLYRERKTLNANQVYLITPNPVFERYIWNVLPELGEKNPRTLMWSELVRRLVPGDRGLGEDITLDTLAAIDAGVETLEITPDDIRDVHVGDRRLLSAEQIWRTLEKFDSVPMGPRRIVLAQEELLEKLRRRVGQLASSDAIHEEMLCLDAEEQDRVFGRQISPADDEELVDCAREYLDDLCAPAFECVEHADWLRIDRIGMRLLGKEGLSAVEWIYLKMTLAGQADTAARLVMVDEVQDYTAAQLTVLARYFSKANFMLLGDENQAITEPAASFAQIREVFESERGSVDECELMTSYRSSPEITALFTSLMPADDRVRTSSIQRPGVEPDLRECAGDEYLPAVCDAVRQARETGGLCAVIVNERARVHWLGKKLAELMGPEAPEVIREGMTLPTDGVIVIDLRLAKGLEFDHVIIPDAQRDVFPSESPVARRRLYTAISRATQRVTILSQGPMSELLAR